MSASNLGSYRKRQQLPAITGKGKTPTPTPQDECSPCFREWRPSATTWGLHFKSPAQHDSSFLYCNSVHWLCFAIRRSCCSSNCTVSLVVLQSTSPSPLHRPAPPLHRGISSLSSCRSARVRCHRILPTRHLECSQVANAYFPPWRTLHVVARRHSSAS